MSVNELEAAGIVSMDDAEIDGFLSSQGVGVLGLPTAEAPYMIPISFGYDGEGSVYFTYVTGPDSQKRELSERADHARFLVYETTSQFAWQSVILTGPLTAVPESDWDEADGVMDNAWHPEAFDTSELDGGIALFRLRVESKNGLKQTDLPPKFRADHSDAPD